MSERRLPLTAANCVPIRNSIGTRKIDRPLFSKYASTVQFKCYLNGGLTKQRDTTCASLPLPPPSKPLNLIDHILYLLKICCCCINFIYLFVFQTNAAAADAGLAVRGGDRGCDCGVEECSKVLRPTTTPQRQLCVR